MPDLIAHHLVEVIPLYVAAVWLFVTTLLSILSGWYRLAAAYLDEAPGEPILRLRVQSCWMGAGVAMRNILSLAVRQQGLRVTMLRLFGPFNRPFLVPWCDIVVTRRRGLFGPVVQLRFGGRGTLTLAADAADRLARAAGPRWPETEPVPPAVRGDLARRLPSRSRLSSSVAMR